MNPDPTDSPSSPSPKPEMLEKAQANIEAAHKVLSDLCNGRVRWRMSIPARPDEDPDLVIGQALHDADTLLAALRASEASVESLRKERDESEIAFKAAHAEMDGAEARLGIAEAYGAVLKAQNERLEAKLEAARAEATNAEDRFREMVEAQPVDLSTGYNWTRRHLLDALAAIRAPRPPLTPEQIKAAHQCDLEGGDGGQGDCDHFPSSPTPPTSPPRPRIFGKCNAFCSWFVTGIHVEGCMALDPDPTPPSEEPRPRESVGVAHSGTYRGGHVCERCGTALYYRIDTAGKPIEMFCPAVSCVLWLLGHPLPVPSPEPPREEPSR